MWIPGWPRTLSVLVVDGERARRERLAGELQRRGFAVRVAVNPRGAAAAAKRRAFDVVVVSDSDPAPVVRGVRAVAPGARFVAIAQAPDLAGWIELGLLGVTEVVAREATADDIAAALGRFAPYAA